MILNGGSKPWSPLVRAPPLVTTLSFGTLAFIGSELTRLTFLCLALDSHFYRRSGQSSVACPMAL